MNWSKLSKEKKQQLLLVVGVTVAVLAGLGFGLVKSQYAELASFAEKKIGAQKKLQQIDDAVKHAQQIESDLAEKRKTLSEQENDVAEGDLYAWVINTLRKFEGGYKVEIPQKSGITGPADVNLLPDFPYKQATLSILGSGHFHDVGRFVADFENRFPHIRIVNLGLEPNANPGPGEQEMLSFRMELVTLVKPSAL